MAKTTMSSVGISKERVWTFSPFPVAATLTALLLGGVMGILNPYVGIGVIGILALIIIFILRQDQLAAALAVAVHLYVDWYLGLRVVSLALTLGLLLAFFAVRSLRHPWAEPRALWLWGLFLALTIYPAIRGTTSLYDTLFYYPNVIFGAFIMFWLGTVVARNIPSTRRLFQWLALLAALLAVVTIIQATTGKLLLSTSHYDAYLAKLVSSKVVGFDQAAPSDIRVGAFFLDPNWNGAFFAMAVFIPLGLFFESASLLAKGMYFVEILLMLPALLFTYSNGSWAGMIVGFMVFILCAGSVHYRILLPLVALIGAGILVVLFPLQIALQLQHAINSYELLSRLGAWQTGLAVIRAFPLTGVGLGFQTYLVRAEPFRSLWQRVPLAHPHCSYLELGAMAGLPVLAVFVALLGVNLWFALQNWARVDKNTRALFGGGIAAVAALSINSISINGWTLPPLAALGWLILGSLSSPLIAQAFDSSAKSRDQMSPQVA